MALDIRLQQKLQQKLVMTPQLRQAIKILQLQREELETLIDEELAENPVLERTEGEEPLTTGPQTETEIATVDSPTPTPQDDINWQAYLDNYSNDMPSLPATLKRASASAYSASSSRCTAARSSSVIRIEARSGLVSALR